MMRKKTKNWMFLSIPAGCMLLFVAMLIGGEAKPAKEQPASGNSEDAINLPSSVTQQPEVAEFVDWLAKTPLTLVGLRVDDAELLGQLMIVRMQHMKVAPDKVDEIRNYFARIGIPHTSLIDEAAHAATLAWFENAVVGTHLNDLQYRIGKPLAECWGIDLTPPPYTKKELKNAQLSVLQEITDGSSRTHVNLVLKRYLEQGMPAEAFELEIMRETARQVTARKILADPWLTRITVKQAESRYGISGEDIYDYLPPGNLDFPAEIDKYLSAPDGTGQSEPLRRMTSVVIRREDAQAIIATTERYGTKESLRLCFLLLGEDWSAVGREYLYNKLLTDPAPRHQESALSTLDARGQFSVAHLAEALDRTNDSSVMERIFDFARSALNAHHTHDDAKIFLLEKLSASNPEHRILAAKTLIRRAGKPDKALLTAALDAITSEQDSHIRARMVRSLRGTGRKMVTNALLDLLRNDSSLEVRLAVVDVISLFATSSVPMSKRNEELISDLRAAARGSGLSRLRDAVEDKIAKYQSEVLDRSAGPIEQRAKAYLRKLRQAASQLDDPDYADSVDLKAFEAELSRISKFIEEHQDSDAPSIPTLRTTVEKMRAKVRQPTRH